ncbi:hypothetical protein [Aneurinibacillus terranovensis]|uniref:hypothetical protein n=1 Tax=Aneurinibacillus terranovensis TaxID=278991 RepID=UPI000418AD29|nr:hypothetical protein [Aneurinibacillus terranovensis]
MHVLLLPVIWFLVRMSMIYLLHVYIEKGWVAANYRQKNIPVGYGTVVPVFLCIFYVLWIQLDGSGGTAIVKTGGEVLLCSLISLVGWVDDRKGDRGIKGLRGHLGALQNSGQLTTGMIKAAAGLLAAAGAAFTINDGTLNIVVNTLIITLAINAINLLDVRPGRALKGFWFLLFLSVCFGSVPPASWPLVLIVSTITVAAAPDDFNARAMMGDVGSNTLGFLAGIFCAAALPFSVRICLLALFIVLHWRAETSSLSLVIQNNKWLNRLDHVGRKT